MPDAKIIIVTKADEDESNTKYAQGGLAVVTDFDNDNFQKHIGKNGQGMTAFNNARYRLQRCKKGISMGFDKNHILKS